MDGKRDLESGERLSLLEFCLVAAQKGHIALDPLYLSFTAFPKGFVTNFTCHFYYVLSVNLLKTIISYSFNYVKYL